MREKKCSRCGLCKGACPVYGVILKETVSPRGKIEIIEAEKLDPEIIYSCTLCGGCEELCPGAVEVKKIIREAREELVKKGIELPENKKMIENIRKFGNPFGELKEGEAPDKLFCC